MMSREETQSPWPKDFERWLLFVLHQRGRCVRREEVSLSSQENRFALPPSLFLCEVQESALSCAEMFRPHRRQFLSPSPANRSAPTLCFEIASDRDRPNPLPSATVDLEIPFER